MKPLYPKNKGKVYPSPSPPPDAVSVLKLLPAAILALAAILSLEDREVLAYLVTRSLNPTSCVSTVEEKKKWKRMSTHKPPMFDCGCFDCYRSYWSRWDSSPNRELINQAIEAFEDHLNNNNSEHTPKSKSSSKSSRSKKREEKIAKIEKIHLQQLETPPEPPTPAPVAVVEVEEEIPVITDAVVVNLSDYEENEQEDLTTNLTHSPEEVIAVRIPGCSHKGMARKFMPDVLGLFNSRLWNIWNPDI